MSVLKALLTLCAQTLNLNKLNATPLMLLLILLDNLFIWKVATSTNLGNRVVNQSSLVISIMHMLPIVIGLPPPALGSIS